MKASAIYIEAARRCANDRMGAPWHLNDICAVPVKLCADQPGVGWRLKDCVLLRRFEALFQPSRKIAKRQPAWSLLEHFWTNDDAILALLFMAQVVAEDDKEYP